MLNSRKPTYPYLMKHSVLLTLIFVAIFSTSSAQDKVGNNVQPSFFNSFLINKIKQSITGNAISMIDTNKIVLDNSIELLSKHAGKQINNIIIEQHNFSTNINLPQLVSKNFFTRTANKLHSISDEETIRKNLFFHENDTLNPTIIAYNEKWLRDLSYIQDARIMASLLLYDTNKVDIYVITKDVFPFSGSLKLRNEKSYEGNISNDNLMGSGTKLQINHNFDNTRKPNSGWGYDAEIRNVLGSFINVSGGINDFTNNSVEGSATALNQYLKAELPLLHPFSKWTGGFEVSEIKNKNAYPSKWSDSIFNRNINYHADYFDFWIGYQLFNKKNKKIINSNRTIIQYRHLEHNFLYRPVNFKDQLDKNYQNINADFFSMTIFKQEIIRTKYLYGFGRNEDLPIGHSLTFTSGKYIRETESLPYIGVRLEKYALTKSGEYTHYNLNVGSSYSQKMIQDFRWLSSIEQISKLKYLDNGLAYRQIINISFTETLKNKFNEALLINSIYGIPQLNKERIRGGTRISANWETVVYNSGSVFNFKSSPFIFGNITYIRSVQQPISKGDIYSSMGAGIRVRNENLIFGTIEMKGYYFPRTTLQLSPWNFSIITNMRFKYNSSIIRKPDFVEIN